MDIAGAFKRPFTNLKNLIIGLIIFNIPLINIFAPAYFFRCIRGTYMGNTSLPDWNNIRGLLKDWLVMFVIGIIFLSVPLLLLIIAFVTISDTPEFLSFIENGFTTNFELYKSIFVLIISNKFLALAFIMLIIASYFQIMTLLIVNDKKIKKVNIQIIIIRALTLNYFIGFIAIGIVGILIAGIVSFIPFIGTGMGNFIAGVISFTLYSQIYLTISK